MFNVTVNEISVIYVTSHRCAGGSKKKLDLRSGSYRHRNVRTEEDVSKIEKVPRGIRGQKLSKDIASSRNLVSTIGAQASPTMGDGTRCPEG